MNEKNENGSLRTVISGPVKFGDHWELVLRVPVDDNPEPQYCIVESDPWHELIKLGLYPKLRLNQQTNAVETWCPKPRRYIALKFFIVDATNEDDVTVANGNHLDLRRSNLIVTRPETKHYRDNLDLEYGRASTLVQYKYDPKWLPDRE